MDKKEKEIKKTKTEKIKKTEKKEKQNKVNLDKKKKLIILISAIVLVAIIGITIFFVLRNDDEYKLADVEPTISTLEDGTYYIFGSPNNQSFEVETKEDFTYKVVDEENNEVKVSTTEKDNKIVINAPEKLYEDGKTYTLTITNGTFTEEELKEATTVSFSIVRKSKQTSELNKDVKVVSSETNKVSETDDKITLTSEEEYKTGDIILIDNKKAYKVESAEDGTYQLTIPAISEVFDEIDYYGSAYLNLSEFEENEEIEEYLIAYAEDTLIEKLIPTVNAASKISVDCDWSDKREAFVAKIHIETNPGDKVFKKSFLEHHKLSFDYEVELKVKFDYDIDDDYVDVNFTLQITNTPSFTLETQSETLDKIKDGLKAYTAGENALALLKSDYKSVEKDTKKLKQTVGTVPIPTPLWFFTAELDFGLIMEFDVKANMNATLTNTNKITIGVNTEKGIYGSTKYNNKINASAFGEASMRLGSQMDLEASLLGMAEVSGGLKGGIYGKATLDIKSEVSDEKLSANLLATTKAGLFSTIVVEAKVITEKFEKEFANTELELYSYELPLSSESEKTEPVVKEEETTTKPETNNNNSNNNTNNNNDSSNNGSSNNNTNTTPTYKYTAAEVRQKLLSGFKQYAPFSYFENGNSPYSEGCGGSGYIGWCYTTKMNVDSNIFEINNKFGGGSDGMENYVGYTCYYNYVNDALSCSNYSNAKSKLQSLCQQDYDDYWYYKNQGLDEGDYGYGIDYNTVNECFNYLIGGSDSNKNYYKTRINKILQYAGLTQSDLGVLK